MLIKTPISKGYCYLEVSFDYRSKAADIGVYTSAADINVFSAAEFERFDYMPLKNFKGVPIMKFCTSELLPAPGEDNNICTIRDYKTIKSLLVDTINWLLSLNKVVTVSPVDARRCKAALRTLRDTFTVTLIENANDEQDVLVITRKVGHQC